MGHNLPLKTRRALARGISPRTLRAWGGRKFYMPAGRATATIGTGNAALYFRANVPGTAGNSITVTIANGGTAPVVTFVGSAITVTTPVATTTAIEVARAVNRAETTDAAGRTIKLVWAARAPGSDGTGLIVASGPTALSGGNAGG